MPLKMGQQPPLEGMIQYDLHIARTYPLYPGATPPSRADVQFRIAFETEEQAERLERKIRKLLEDDNMEVTLNSPKPTVKTNEPYAGGLYED